MTDQELLAYEREHHGDPYMTLLKAKRMQRVALQFFIRTRRYDQSESVARGVIIDLLPSPVTLRSCCLRVL
jgi:hypothetical protein